MSLTQIIDTPPTVSDTSALSQLTLLSIVIPARDEAGCIASTVEHLHLELRLHGVPHEIVVVDDGSSDSSAELIERAANAEGSSVIGVLLNRNYGQHAAVMAGFAETTGDLIITLDADLQNPPEEIPRLIAKGAEGYDVVATRRMNRQEENDLRKR